jgi:hypothetical protein
MISSQTLLTRFNNSKKSPVDATPATAKGQKWTTALFKAIRAISPGLGKWCSCCGVVIFSNTLGSVIDVRGDVLEDESPDSEYGRMKWELDGENGESNGTEIAIYTFAFVSDADNGFTTEGLRHEALRLLEAIEVSTLKKGSRLLFIGHALGGLLIKEVSEPRFKPH